MKSSATDFAVSLAVLILSGVLVFLYVQERGRSTVRADETPLGTIVFKKLSATRRARAALIWERMRNNSPVYAADTLRTATASEASVYFDDGTNLDMFENSMLRLDFEGADRTVEFLGGDIAIQGPTAQLNADLSGLPDQKRGRVTGGYTISAGGKTITVTEGSQASLSRTGDTLSVEVLDGEIEVTHSDGTRETIEQAKELEIDLASGTAQVTEISVFPLLPEQNARLLIERSGSAKVPFSWNLEGSVTSTIEISESRDFDPLAASAAATGNSLNLEIAPGTWYWRIRTADGTLSSVRRFSLSAELPPRPILPAPGADVFYRERLPAVRFSWTEMTDATAYIFEIAGDEEFTRPVLRNRTTMAGLTVDSLGEGTWYWRVLPVYPMTLLEKKAEPEVRALSIGRRAEMAAVSPTMPLADAMFLVQEVAGKGIGFSWVPDSEAVEYELSVGASPDMRNPALARTLGQAWFTLSGSEAASLETPGTWYWAVRWKDEEGNVSPFSAPRLLQGIDGAIAVRLSFPPQGYTMADSLVDNTRFAWKSNVPAKTVFQLSEDPSFSAVAWEEPADTETLIGGRWKTGVWYWRIRTLNTDGSVLHDTEPRMFRVVDPLPEPTLVSPASGALFYLRKEDAYTFSWADVPGADYYQFRLYSITDAGGEVLRHSSASQRETSVELPFGEYADGRYRVLLQAFSLDKESSTRIIGYLGRTEIVFKRISRMELSTPAANAVFEGLDARRHGISLSWQVPDPPESSQLLVSRDPEGRSVLLRRTAAPGKALLERLAAGDYFWTVTGKLHGLDISAQKTDRFTVRAIPLLPSPRGLVPAAGFTFGPQELRGLSALRFGWDAVPDATQYAFSLSRVADSSVVAHSDSLAGNSFTLGDLSVLQPGEYRWTVRALAFDSKGELEQEGVPVESGFRIELPRLQSPEPKGKETFYGR